MITPSNQPATYVEYVTDLRPKMQKAHDVARHHLARTSTRQKDTYDAKSSMHSYVPGDLDGYYMNRDQRASVQNWK